MVQCSQHQHSASPRSRSHISTVYLTHPKNKKIFLEGSSLCRFVMKNNTRICFVNGQFKFTNDYYKCGSWINTKKYMSNAQVIHSTFIYYSLLNNNSVKEMYLSYLFHTPPMRLMSLHWQTMGVTKYINTVSCFFCNLFNAYISSVYVYGNSVIKNIWKKHSPEIIWLKIYSITPN